MIAKSLLLTAALTLVSSDLPPGAEGRWAATPAACANGPSVELTPSAVILKSGARTASGRWTIV